MADGETSRLGECLVGEMSGWGNVQVGEMSIGGMSGWGNVQVGEMSSWGNVRLGKCPIGEMSGHRPGVVDVRRWRAVPDVLGMAPVVGVALVALPLGGQIGLFQGQIRSNGLKVLAMALRNFIWP